MFKLPKILGSALLAVSVFASGLALAGPSYHVTLDTSAYAGTSGNVDFNLLAVTGATGATVVLSNFDGVPGSTAIAYGAVSGALPGPVTFMNADGYNDLFQSIIFQNSLSFDLNFAGDFLSMAGSDGSTFAVSLFNEAGSDYLGAPGSKVEFALTPISGNSGGSVAISLIAAGVSAAPLAAAAVPEPSELMLMLTAFGLMGVMVKRRQA